MFKFYFYFSFFLLVVFMVRLPTNYASNYAVRPSPIQGVGVFSTRDIKPNETVELAVKIGDTFQITPYFGSLLNHSNKNDNIELRKMNDGNYYAISTTYIPFDTEITIDYDGPTIPDFIDGSKSYFI